MKHKEGIKRIYIVISIVWFLFFLITFIKEISTNTIGDQMRMQDGAMFDFAYYWLIGAFVPLPLFFIINWVANGFDKN